jgi:NodT family efflux transporter outer membrane factor (OMF) lipoprotein
LTGLCALALAAGAAGCAVGPDFHTPPPPSTAVYATDDAERPDRPVDAQWWRAFGSPELDAMVDEALKANPDLKSADAALRQARALYKAQQGALFPALDAGYQSEQAKNSAAIAPPLADNSELYSLHTAQLTVTYPIDVFGAVRRGTEAAQAQAEAARFQYQAARTSLIANVAASAFQQAALARQADAARQTAEDARRALELIRAQARLGELGQADVANQEAALGQADQALAPLQKSLAQQRSALAILLGREPGEGAPPDLDLDRLTLPAQTPYLLPADLVRRRPDVRVAEANLHAAGAQVGVAIAARLPNIALGASVGGASTQLRDLLASDNSFWSLTAGFTQPIFEGGALKQKQKAAEAAFDQTKSQYRSTVLQALKNVADSLDGLARDDQTFKAAQSSAAAAARSLAFARASHQAGEVGALQELTAEQTDAQARSALAAADAARYADTAALYQALGGD